MSIIEDVSSSSSTQLLDCTSISSSSKKNCKISSKADTNFGASGKAGTSSSTSSISSTSSSAVSRGTLTSRDGINSVSSQFRSESVTSSGDSSETGTSFGASNRVVNSSVRAVSDMRDTSDVQKSEKIKKKKKILKIKSYVTNNDSEKSFNSREVRIDEIPEMVPINEKIYNEPVDILFSELPEDYVYEEFTKLKQKWLGDVDLQDPMIKILEIGMRNFEVTDENLTMERLSIGFKKAKYEVSAWHTYFFQTDSLKKNDPETNLSYTLVFNKISEILWYMEKTIRNIFRTKLVLDPEYDSSMNDDNDLLRFRPIDINTVNDYQQLYFILMTILFEKRYRRYGDICYKRVFNEHGKFTYSWKEAMTIEEFVYSNTSPIYESSFLAATSAKNTSTEIVKYLKLVQDPRFPDLKKDRHVFSFKNGVYVAKYNKDELGNWHDYFYRYGDRPPLPSTVVSSKYFDIDFNNFDTVEDWYSIPTPNLQKILDYQFQDEKEYEEICRWFYIILGKMIYYLKELDRWHILPFLLGQAGSGKSTVTKVIENFYDSNDVGTIENRNEPIFGLELVMDKYIYIMSELKKDFNMDQAILQKIISGEKVNIPRKYKGPKCVIWLSPGFMCANEVPGFGDAAGSMSRRLIVFKYIKPILDIDSDPHLEIKLEKEMAAILKKVNSAYLDAINKYKYKDIWKVIPKYFHKTKEQLGQETNPLKSFLASDRVEFGVNCYIPEKIFKIAFRDHCIENNLGKPRWSTSLFEEPFSVFSRKYKVPITIERRTKKNYPRNQEYEKPQLNYIIGLDIISENNNEIPEVDL